MTTDECRKAFEHEKQLALDRAGEFYMSELTQGQWEYWQAAWNRRAEPGAEALEVAERALLLAARWFKLNFDDDTLQDFPPSKADLAGMFDAMQTARIAIAAMQEPPK